MKTSLSTSLKKFLNVEHIVPLGRASLGIYAALRAWNRTGIVAVSSAVCQDVIAAILMAEWIPFFCDVDPITGLINNSEWLRAKSEGANAAIVVHLYGNPANTADVRRIFPDGLVIDDAAQALGAQLPSSSYLAGTGGNVGLISFGKSKQIEIGGAILICEDFNFAQACASEMAAVESATAQERLVIELAFRNKFQQAREKLRLCGDTTGFAGLLEGYSPALRVIWQPDWSNAIEQALVKYPIQLAMRHEKVNLWRDAIEGTGLIPVGMGPESAPWRFACRLPGCDWKNQYAIGEQLRSKGFDISHWYLPAHWLVSHSIQSLPGAELLAKEAFQFWIDDSIDAESIRRSAEILHKIFN